jgi:hypothetical protein
VRKRQAYEPARVGVRVRVSVIIGPKLTILRATIPILGHPSPPTLLDSPRHPIVHLCILMYLGTKASHVIAPFIATDLQGYIDAVLLKVIQQPKLRSSILHATADYPPDEN